MSIPEYKEPHEVYREWIEKRSANAEKDQGDYITRISKEACGGLGTFVAEYLLALLDSSRKGHDESKEKLMGKREELSKRLNQFAGTQVVETTRLFVGEMQAKIAARVFDPQPDYK